MIATTGSSGDLAVVVTGTGVTGVVTTVVSVVGRGVGVLVYRAEVGVKVIRSMKPGSVESVNP